MDMILEYSQSKFLNSISSASEQSCSEQRRFISVKRPQKFDLGAFFNGMGME